MNLNRAAGLAGVVSVAVILRPDAVVGFYEQIYPSDPVLRRALTECFIQDRNFDGLDSAAREACYRQSTAVHQVAAVGVPHGPSDNNFVDRWRAAGLGRMPQNDIRTEQRLR